jgi:hypothetical protein
MALIYVLILIFVLRSFAACILFRKHEELLLFWQTVTHSDGVRSAPQFKHRYSRTEGKECRPRKYMAMLLDYSVKLYVQTPGTLTSTSLSNWFGYVASNHRKIFHWWIDKNVERSGHELLYGIISAFAWRAWGKPREISVRFTRSREFLFMSYNFCNLELQIFITLLEFLIESLLKTYWFFR